MIIWCDPRGQRHRTGGIHEKSDHCSDRCSQYRCGAGRSAAIARPGPEAESAVWPGSEGRTGQTGSAAESSSPQTGAAAESSSPQTGARETASAAPAAETGSQAS